MKNFKILMYLSLVLLSIVSCTKENIEEPEVIDPIIDVVETSHNALVAQVNSGDGFDLGCFSIDLPFDLTIDGIATTIESTEDFEAALTNAGETAEIDFIYPINITYEDGETAVIADGIALGEAFSVCVPDDGWVVIDGGFPAYVINTENSCYELSYPVTLTDIDENTITVEDETAFIDALANNNILFFSFPLTLVDQDGEEVTAENDEELFELFFECEGTHPPCDSIPYTGSGGFACYSLSFPLGVIQIDADGNETTIILENVDDLNNNLLNGDIVGFAYPLTLIDEEGNEVVVNNEEEMGLAFFECEGFVEPTDPGEAIIFLSGDISSGGNCYDIQYPITLVDQDGVVIESTNNSEETFEIILSMVNGFSLNVSYPVDVVLASDNSTVTITNLEELIVLIEECQ